MSDWLRNIGALVLGLAVGSVCNLSLIEVNEIFFGPPETVEPGDLEQFNAHVRSLPAHAFILVILAHLSQVFVGGWIAARLAASNPQRMALAIGVISLAGGVMAMTLIDGPAWLATELPMYLLIAWWVGRLEAKRRLLLSDEA